MSIIVRREPILPYRAGFCGKEFCDYCFHNVYLSADAVTRDLPADEQYEQQYAEWLSADYEDIMKRYRDGFVPCGDDCTCAQAYEIIEVTQQQVTEALAMPSMSNIIVDLLGPRPANINTLVVIEQEAEQEYEYDNDRYDDQYYDND